MKIYLVGGAIRDRLLGRPVTERDYVVVGATAQELLDQGFRRVGKDFPVFLHPETHEEYALARTERKTKPGYHGFAIHAEPDVSLEDDLRRRDLTINSLAEDEKGLLIDFYGGRADLENRVLRHVSPAFTEDPVRILRVARFAARYAELGFWVADETLHLMQQMVRSGEVDALVPERVWQELVKALADPLPSRFFQVLRDCGALARLFPEIEQLFGVPQPEHWHPEVDTGVHALMVVDTAARLSKDTEVRFAALSHDLGKGATPAAILPSHHGHEQRGLSLINALCDRLKAPKRFRDLALIVARHHGRVHQAGKLNAKTLLKLLEHTDALRRPTRFEQMLTACEADFRGRIGFADRDYPQARILRQALSAIRGLDLRAITRDEKDPQRIQAHIHRSRIAKIMEAMESFNPSL